MSLPPLPVLADEPTDMTEPDRRELVAEAFHTFGEDAASELAVRFGISLAACRMEIDALARQALAEN